MKWIQQQKEWPNFIYDKEIAKSLENEFLEASGIYKGVTLHLSEDDKDDFTVDILSGEAFKTSEIEGEFLQRSSIQSSIKKNLGLVSDNKRVSAAERGISKVMIDLYKSFNKPLSHECMFKWHRMMMEGRKDFKY